VFCPESVLCESLVLALAVALLLHWQLQLHVAFNWQLLFCCMCHFVVLHGMLHFLGHVSDVFCSILHWFNVLCWLLVLVGCSFFFYKCLCWCCVVLALWLCCIALHGQSLCCVGHCIVSFYCIGHCVTLLHLPLHWPLPYCICCICCIIMLHLLHHVASI